MARLTEIRVSTAMCVLCLLVVLLSHCPTEGSPVEVASYYDSANGPSGGYYHQVRREYQPRPYREMRRKNGYPEAPNVRSSRQFAEMKTRYASLFFK